MSGKLNVSFLWHMHQPYYRDPKTGQYAMPWVRLHAVKGYRDMIEAVKRYGGKGVTFNLVPSLLLQLEDLASGKEVDVYQTLSSKAPEQLDIGEKSIILRHFFSANHDTMVLPFRRYRNLLKKRGNDLSNNGIESAIRRFSDIDLLDLQVWFNLTWSGWAVEEENSLIHELKKKGQYFTEDDKSSLLNLQLEVLKGIIPAYKKIWNKNLIDVSTTPFYHPILPLLVDNYAAAISQPRDPLPGKRFQHPEDAEVQLNRSRDFIKSKLGKEPDGLWPSEGSVSPIVCELAEKAGFKWLATDERILMATLPGLKREEIIYSGYQTANSGPIIYFRDQGLSDAIGFRYAKNPSEKSVSDFISHLEVIADSFKHSEEHIVAVILDGENAWEYFPDGGKEFFNQLYGRLHDHKKLQLTTFSDFTATHTEQKELPPIFPASWINGSFRIWIGDPIKNKAWEHLYNAAKLLDELKQKKTESTILQKAQELLYIAEGSDWFWWYGSPNTSSFDAEFDYLFRMNLMQIYEIAGIDTPEDLKLPLSSESSSIKVEDFFPIHPIINGRETHFYEWIGAVKVLSGDYAGAMNIGETLVTRLFYGLSESSFYIRIDAPDDFWQVKGQEIVIQMEKEGQAVISLRNLNNPKELLLSWQGELPPREMPEAALDVFLEIGIPFVNFICDNQRIKFSIIVKRESLEVERWPREGSFTCPCPSEELFGSNWIV